MLSRQTARATKFRRWYSTVEENGFQELELKTTQDWQNLQMRRKERQMINERFTQLGSTQTRDNTWQPFHTLHRPVEPSQLTISSLMASGAHFGHNHTLMNSNFLPFAYGERAGITIIDMDKALPLLRRAINATRAIAERGGSMVFVGTSPQLQRVVSKAAARMPKNGYHVGQRWLAGTLTNRVQFYGPDKAQTTQIVPDLVIILNPLKNMHVIRECSLSHVPTIALIDSNVDPRIVTYPIPANDDSTRTAEVIAGVLSIAAREGVKNFLAREAATTEDETLETRRVQRQRLSSQAYKNVDIQELHYVDQSIQQ